MQVLSGFFQQFFQSFDFQEVSLNVLKTIHVHLVETVIVSCELVVLLRKFILLPGLQFQLGFQSEDFRVFFHF